MENWLGSKPVRDSLWVILGVEALHGPVTKNPKSEYRNSKQIQKKKGGKFQTVHSPNACWNRKRATHETHHHEGPVVDVI